MERSDIIQCSACGQRMRLPANTQGKVFKCVKCGALVQTGRGTPPPVTLDMPDKKQQPQEQAARSMADLFIDMGLTTRENIEKAEAAKEPGEKLFETLLRLELITKETLHAHMAKEGHAGINLAHFNIDRDLTELIPLDLVRKHWVLPMSSLGKSLTVAMICPVDMESRLAIEQATKMRIRPMLCKVDDFLAAVRKHYRVPDANDIIEGESSAAQLQRESASAAAAEISYPGDEAIREALANLDRLPIPTRVMNQVDAVVGAENEGLRQVVSVVGNSPALTLNILSTANSTAYGLPKSVDSIPMAVTLVGEQAVSLLAANSPKLAMADENQWKPLTNFSRHCAEIAAILAVDCGRVTPNVAYCAALLHAIGSYALGALEAEEYAKIDPGFLREKRLHAEKQVFGISHDEAGALICEMWGLPEVFQIAIGNVYKPEEAGDYRDIATILNIAVNLAGTDGEVNQDGVAKSTDAMKSLGIEPSGIIASLGKPAEETANTSS